MIKRPQQQHSNDKKGNEKMRTISMKNVSPLKRKCILFCIFMMIIMKIIALCDLYHRSVQSIRGTKKKWFFAILLFPPAPIIYFLCGIKDQVIDQEKNEAVG